MNFAANDWTGANFSQRTGIQTVELVEISNVRKLPPQRKAYSAPARTPRIADRAAAPAVEQIIRAVRG